MHIIFIAVYPVHPRADPSRLADVQPGARAGAVVLDAVAQRAAGLGGADACCAMPSDGHISFYN